MYAARLLLSGMQVRSEMVNPVHGDSTSRSDGAAGSAPAIDGAAGAARQKRQGDGSALCRAIGATDFSEGAYRLSGGQLDRNAASAAEFRLLDVSAWTGQFLGPGRQELYAPHDRIRLCDFQTAGPHVS